MADLALPQAAHAPAGVLLRERERALQVALRARQLLGRQALLGDLFQLAHHDREHLLGARRRGARVDAEHARLGVHRVVGEDRVREPALLPHLLEQTRGHPAADRVVHQPEGESPWVAAREARDPDADVRLLCGAVPHEGAAAGRRLLAPGAQRGVVPVHPLPRRKVLLHQSRHRIVLHVARSHHDEVPRDVMLLPEPPDLVAAPRRHRLYRPQHGPPQWVLAPHRLQEDVVHELVGRVLVHVDLLQDHLALGIEVRRLDHRVLKHVAEEVHRHGHVAVEDARVERRVLLGRVRVQVAADRIEGLGDVAGRARPRPLEEQVLKEVGCAGQPRLLVARAGVDPDAEGRGSDPRHMLGHQAQSRAVLAAPDLFAGQG